MRLLNIDLFLDYVEIALPYSNYKDANDLEHILANIVARSYKHYLRKASAI